MTRALRWSLSITDILFIAYWILALADLVGLLRLPTELMYAGHDQPRVVAWNWSFFPLDLAFSATGLWAVRAARQGRAIWRPLALVSLTLTMVAGGMAVGYWTILREFDPAWYLPNLLLLIWPIPHLVGIVRTLSGADPAEHAGARDGGTLRSGRSHVRTNSP